MIAVPRPQPAKPSRDLEPAVTVPRAASRALEPAVTVPRALCRTAPSPGHTLAGSPAGNLRDAGGAGMAS